MTISILFSAILEECKRTSPNIAKKYINYEISKLEKIKPK